MTETATPHRFTRSRYAIFAHGVSHAKVGRFFTPYNVSRMMAEMSLQDVGTFIEANDYTTMSDPACGAAGMVLAAADRLQRNGCDPSTEMLGSTVDISPLWFHVNVFANGPSRHPRPLEVGDALRMTRTESA